MDQDNSVKAPYKRIVLFSVLIFIAALAACILLIGNGASAVSASEQLYYNLGITPEGSGRVDQDWDPDTKILTLTAVPYSGSTFLYWTEPYYDDEIGDTNERLITDGDPFDPVLSWKVTESGRPVIARFRKNGEYFIYDGSSWNKKGELIISPDQGSFRPGQEIFISAIANEGYVTVGIEYAIALVDPLLGDDEVEWIRLSDSDTANLTMPASDIWVRGVFRSTAPHTVTLISDGGNGSVTFEDGTTEKEITAGTTVNLKITPDYAYRADVISGVPADFDLKTYSFEMPDRDLEIHVSFAELEKYELTVRISPLELLSKINEAYDIVIATNEETGLVVLGAGRKSESYPGLFFAGWYDEKTGKLLTDEQIYMFIIKEDTAIEARFEMGYAVFTNKTQNGTLTLYPEDRTYFREGETVKLIGTPNEGYILDHFSYLKYKDVEAYQNGQYDLMKTIDGDTVTVGNEDVIVFAFFTRSYDISASSDNEAGGTVFGSAIYKENSTVTLTAVPEEGYMFVYWMDGSHDVVSLSATYEFTATEDAEYIAHFAKIVSVTATSADETQGTVSGSGQFAVGESVTVSAMPKTDYVFVNWTVDGNEVSTSSSYTFYPEEDTVLVANFKKQTWYRISNEKELRQFAKAVNSGETGAKGILTADIVLSDTIWTPIGSMNSPFSGVFDGDGHTVTGMHCDSTSSREVFGKYVYYYIGFFGQVEGGTVKNVTLKDAHVDCNHSDDFSTRLGAIAGCIFDGVTISNCRVTGTNTITAKGCFYAELGGIVGTVYGDNAIIENCCLDGNTTVISNGSYAYAGGIAGYVGYGEVRCCFRNDSGLIETVSGRGRAGGVVGRLEGVAVGVQMSDCYNIGDVAAIGSGNLNCAGGVIGYNNFSGEAANCYSIGKVSSETGGYAGGAVGYNAGIIRDFYCSADDCPGVEAIGAMDDDEDEYHENVAALSADEMADLVANSGFSEDVWIQGAISPLLRFNTHYKLTVHLNDGTDAAKEYGFEKKLVIGQLRLPFKYEGHTFAGLNSKADGNGKKYGPEDVITEDTVLYAVWEVNRYEVRFIIDEEHVLQSETVEYGTVLTEPAAPQKNGYDFTGWYSDEKRTEPADLTAAVTGNVTFYAGFEEVFYVSEAPSSWDPADGKDLVITVKRSRNDDLTLGLFDGVYADGKPVDPSHYKAEKGSVILTVDRGFLSELDSGDHEIEVRFTDGSIAVNVYIEQKIEPPPTGDGSLMIIRAAAAAAALALAAVTVTKRRRRAV